MPKHTNDIRTVAPSLIPVSYTHPDVYKRQGYASGWGAYWFGMNYPLRFLIAAIVMIAIAVIHQQSEKGWLAPFRGFFKVWLSSGLFFAEMALWLLSLLSLIHI